MVKEIGVLGERALKIAVGNTNFWEQTFQGSLPNHKTKDLLSLEKNLLYMVKYYRHGTH